MSEIRYGNFKNRLYYLQMNIKATRRNDTNDFCMNFNMLSFTQKRLYQWNASECSIKEDFNQNGRLSIS